jgi:hypothetical protein
MLVEDVMSHMPNYVWALAITAAIGIPGMTAVILGYGARKAGESRRTGLVAVAAVASWLAVSAALAGVGVFQQGARHAAPWFGIAFAVGLGGALLASRLPTVRRALSAPGMTSWLELPHMLRIEGAVFLILMIQGQLPAVFALPAGIGDIVAGLSAPFVARHLARGTGSWAIGFAVFGIADLIVALSIAFLAGLGPVRVFHGASTLPLSQLPLALIPMVAVPTAIALHVVSLTQLRHYATASAAGHHSGRQLRDSLLGAARRLRVCPAS